MQIFKNLLLACSIAVATSPLYLQAEDTDAQAAARAALQQKMRELKGGSATIEAPATIPAPAPENAPTPPPAPKKAKATPSVIEPVAAAPVTPAAPVIAVEGASSDLIEQARAATRARMAELQGNPKTAIPVGHEAPVPMAEPTLHPAPDVVTTTTTVTAPTKPSKDDARMARESEAAAKKADADAKAKAAAEAKAREAAEKAATKAAKKSKTAAVTEAPVLFTPLEAPASSLATTKEQALSALTEQYKADKITAEEYHEQRAKILAEP